MSFSQNKRLIIIQQLKRRNQLSQQVDFLSSHKVFRLPILLLMIPTTKRVDSLQFQRLKIGVGQSRERRNQSIGSR
jgi:hypothetical protein